MKFEFLIEIKEEINNFQHELAYSNGTKLRASDKEYREKLRKLQTLKYWKNFSVSQIIFQAVELFSL